MPRTLDITEAGNQNAFANRHICSTIEDSKAAHISTGLKVKKGLPGHNKSAVPVQSDSVVNLDLAVLPSPKVDRSVNADAVADRYRPSATM